MSPRFSSDVSDMSNCVSLAAHPADQTGAVDSVPTSGPCMYCTVAHTYCRTDETLPTPRGMPLYLNLIPSPANVIVFFVDGGDGPLGLSYYIVALLVASNCRAIQAT